jgi:hypothetical protein
VVPLPVFCSSGHSTQSRALWTYESVLLSGLHPGSRWSSGYDLRRAVVNPPDQRTDLAFPFEPQHCRSILLKKNSSQGFRSIQVEGGVTLLRVDVSFFASFIFFFSFFSFYFSRYQSSESRSFITNFLFSSTYVLLNYDSQSGERIGSGKETYVLLDGEP